MSTASRIASGDVSIFQVETQTSVNDRRSLLRLQSLVGDAFPGYGYLEVGSHLGGSIFPHLIDDRCGRIVSIDPRPSDYPDERGILIRHTQNSAERMLQTLEEAAGPGAASKIATFTSQASQVNRAQVGPGIRLALIDGEHTNRAAFADFANVLQLVEEDCVIGFHDANILVDAVWNVGTLLDFIKRKHAIFFLPDVVCAVALGNLIDPAVTALKAHCIDPHLFYQKAKQWIRSVQRDIGGRVAVLK